MKHVARRVANVKVLLFQDHDKEGEAAFQAVTLERLGICFTIHETNSRRLVAA